MYREPPLPPGVPEAGVAVARALLSRRSVRGFLPVPVSRATVESILHLAARAPSGTNVQPWKVYACTGAVRDALAEELAALHDAGGGGHEQEYAYYPRQWREPTGKSRGTKDKDCSPAAQLGWRSWSASSESSGRFVSC